MSMETDKRQSLVPKELNLCNKAIEHLFVELNELENRIVSCLSAPGPDPEEAEQLESGVVPLANDLAMLHT